MKMQIYSQSWDELSTNEEVYLLSQYFKSSETIDKHVNKKWNQLPYNFKRFLIRNELVEIN